MSNNANTSHNYVIILVFMFMIFVIYLSSEHDHRPWNGTHRTEESVQKDNMALSEDRKTKVDEATLPEN
jgi:hypothetical protein